MIVRLFPLGLALLVLTVFSPSYTSEFVRYDDPAYITYNGYVNQGLTAKGIQWAFTQQDLGEPLMHLGVGNVWHPLTWMSHMVDVHIFGLENPGGHHVHSLVLHLLSVLLLYACLLKLDVRPILAACGAAFFAIHPMHVESVAWVSERKDVLSGVFFFASLLAYLGTRKWLSVGLYVLALMAKPSVVVFSGVLLLLDWWRAGMSLKFNLRRCCQEMKAKLPWILPALGVVFLTVFSQYSGTHGDFVMPLKQRFMHMPSSLAFYLWRTIWPFDLSYHYPYPSGNGVLGAAFLILAIALGTLWRVRERFPYLVFGVLWFLLFWLPVSGIFQVGSSFTADRYTYLAHVGLFLGFLVTWKRSLCWALPLLLFWSVLAYRQTGVWKNSETLFTHGVEAQPRDPVTLQNLAGLHQIRGEHEKAIPLFKKAISLNALDYMAQYNLGNSLRDTGDLLGARASYESSLKSYPQYIPAYVGLARLLMVDDLPVAEKYAREACELTSYGHFKSVGTYVEIMLKSGRVELAREILAKAPEHVRKKISITRQ